MCLEVAWPVCGTGLPGALPRPCSHPPCTHHSQALQRARQVALDVGGQVGRVVGDGLAVKGGGAVELDAQRLLVVLVAQLAHLVGGGQQGLGGHTAAVDASAADVVPLDDGHLEAALHCVQRGAVAAHAAADDDQIVVVRVAAAGGGAGCGAVLAGRLNAHHPASDAAAQVRGCWLVQEQAFAARRSSLTRGRSTSMAVGA